MAITKIDPAGFDQANSVLIDSDAPTNAQAIQEIDAWAAAHGFARTTEYWLRTVVSGGRQRFRGVCYRLTDEERAGTEQYLREVQESSQRLIPRRTA